MGNDQSVLTEMWAAINDIRERMVRMETTLSAHFQERCDERGRRIEALEKKVEVLQRRMWMGMGAISVISFSLPFILKYIFK